MKRHLPGAFSKLLLLAVSSFVGLLMMDYAIYALFVREPTPHDSGLYRAEAERGFGLTPGFRGVYRTRGGETPITVNSSGFRGPEWTFDAATRVMAVGDSFTFGIPLAVEDGFLAKAEAKLGHGYRLYNLGVPGYGPAHILPTVERYCGTIRPAHVMYFFFANDLRDDNLATDAVRAVDGYLVRRAAGGRELSDDELLARVRGRQESRYSLAAGLGLVHIRTFMAERGIHPSQLLKRGTPAAAESYLVTRGPGYSDENVARAAEQIRRVKQAAEACGARFTMVVLPGHVEAFHGLVEPGTRDLLARLDGAVEVLDLHRHMRPGDNLVQWYDAHYSPKGTELVANVLAGYLAGRYPASPGQ